MSEILLSPEELASLAPDLDLSAFSLTTVSGMISGASAQLARYCNVDGFLAKTVTETGELIVNNHAEIGVSFRRPPVQQGAVSSFKIKAVEYDYDVELTQNGMDRYFITNPGTYMKLPSNYLMALGNGFVYMRDAGYYYEVTYTGGYATGVAELPFDLKRAVVLLVRDALDATTNPGNVTSFRNGSYSETRQVASDGSGVGPFAQQAFSIAAPFVRVA